MALTNETGGPSGAPDDLAWGDLHVNALERVDRRLPFSVALLEAAYPYPFCFHVSRL